MKKVVNNKLFLIIITAIICIGGTVTATVLYNANQISYVPKDSAWEASDVKTALDDLYTMADSIINAPQNTIKSFPLNPYSTGWNGFAGVSYYDLKGISNYNNLVLWENLFIRIDSEAEESTGPGGHGFYYSYDSSSGILTAQIYRDQRPSSITAFTID